MRLAPAEYAEQLAAQGLPAGPLEGPLTYLRLPRGKLHVERGCRRIPVNLRTQLEEVTLTAAAAHRNRLCPECCERMPEPAREWELACLALTNARKLVGTLTANPQGWQRRWDEVVDVDIMIGNVRHLCGILPDDQRAELDPHARAALDQLRAVRVQIVTEIGDDIDQVTAHVRDAGLLPDDVDPQQPHVVAVTNATRSARMSGHGRFSAANLYSQVNPVLDEATCLGFAVAPAAIVVAFVDAAADTMQMRAHDLGPAAAGDTAETLRTAATVAAGMLDFGQRNRLTDIPVTLLTDALVVARGIHTTAT